MKKLQYIVPLLLVIWACKKEPTSSNLEVTVVVQDIAGLPIGNATLTTDQGAERRTNSQGLLVLRDLIIGTRVAVNHPDFTFEPNEKQVLEDGAPIVFLGLPNITPQEMLMRNWLEKQQLSNGLMESSEGGTMLSLYDNALAALVFLSYGNYPQAEKIFDFFTSRIDNELKVGNGGFAQFRYKNGNPLQHIWLGDNAWLLIALNNYKSQTNQTKYNRLISELGNWIISLQDSDGGIWGGFREDNSRIHKVTEGNIDAFNAIPGYTSFHKDLLHFLKTDRWDVAHQSLIAWKDNPQYYFALDIHPWSYCIFEDFPEATLATANRFVTTQIATINTAQVTGFCFDDDKDAVWLEGTGQMVVALQKARQQHAAAFYLKEMEKVLITSAFHQDAAGLPYATNLGTSYGAGPLWTGADTKPALSSVAWYLFACRRFDPFAVGLQKNVPQEDRFWLLP